MDVNENSKLTGIRQIVRLKELLQNWQLVALTAISRPEEQSHGDPIPGSPRGLPRIINRRLTDAIYCDSDEDGCQSPEPPPDVPKGYLAVYVGAELRRFIIPTSYLSHSLFKLLLEKAEEEFGFHHGGGLTIPCEIETFKYLLKCMENHRRANVACPNEIHG